MKFVSYTEDSADLITSYRLGYHLYADDTQLIGCAKISDVSCTIDRLQRCVTAVGDWCASRRLQLNPSKTELIWFGSHISLRKITTNDLSLRVGNDGVTPVDAVCNLSVILDSELTMQRQSTKLPVPASSTTSFYTVFYPVNCVSFLFLFYSLFTIVNH